MVYYFGTHPLFSAINLLAAADHNSGPCFLPLSNLSKDICPTHKPQLHLKSTLEPKCWQAPKGIQQASWLWTTARDLELGLWICGSTHMQNPTSGDISVVTESKKVSGPHGMQRYTLGQRQLKFQHQKMGLSAFIMEGGERAMLLVLMVHINTLHHSSHFPIICSMKKYYANQQQLQNKACSVKKKLCKPAWGLGWGLVEFEGRECTAWSAAWTKLLVAYDSVSSTCLLCN